MNVKRAGPGRLFLGLLFLGACLSLYGVDWYVSNPSGMSLEPAAAQVALRSEYALSVEIVPGSRLPEELRPYYSRSYQVELRILHRNGEEARRQWRFLDSSGRIRLSAIFNETAFIEVYNSGGLLLEEHERDSAGIERVVTFFYNDLFLVRAETRIGSEAYCTDSYRYTRSGSLRSVERTYLVDVPAGEGPVLLTFPPISRHALADESFVNPGLAYSSEFFEDLLISAGTRIVYTADSRGRVLTETWLDETGKETGVLTNTWNGDRLARVHWQSGEDERLSEYEYDGAGNRIGEKNYTRGVLERTVRREGNREVEELYMNGRVILRAIWEDGRKVSEERVR